MSIESMLSPIQLLGIENNNFLYIKREDLIPYCFGGNKARKALLFFAEIDRGNYDCVVTYGSSSSNHCRVISNMAYKRNMPCYIVSPLEASEITFNRKLMDLFDAEITVVPVDDVHNTIENIISYLRKNGKNPYFIPGGGHGNIGTQAFVDCYAEIKEYEKEHNVFFDYIFFASGTGTTQAGLVCGQLKYNDYNRKIVGISIARKNPRGRNVVIDSIHEYMEDAVEVEDTVIFDDSCVGDGYGTINSADVINDMMKKYGIPLDGTYTGKAYFGMKKYIQENSIKEKNILFIHTGGTPLFFDYILKGIK